jgi:Mg-chelatase subunit ChlD
MTLRRSLLTVAVVSFIVASPLFADVRKQNIDIMVALDKSLSMQNKVVAVEDWVNSFLIDQIAVPGDFFDVIVFYGKADVVISQTIKNDADKAAIKKIISGIRGNGRFTDIGNALDVLKSQLATKENDGRDKYVLLLTDGIQEAPPTSKYYSPDGKFNHEFLANTKTIQEKGWKIMILGIGTETAAKDLATTLSGSYTEITGKVSTNALAQSASELFGAPTLQGPVQVAPVSSDGSSSILFTLKPSGTPGSSSVTVNRIDARINGGSSSSILTTPLSITIKKGTEQAAKIPVRFPAGLPEGSNAATLAFSFPPGQGFVPSNVDVSFRVKGWMENNTLPLGVGVVLIIAIIVALVLLLRRLPGGSQSFLVLVDHSPLSKSPVNLASGHDLFLNELKGDFSLISKRNARSLVRFFVKDKKVGMGVLKADRFPKLEEVPAEVRGESFVLRTESGRKLDLEIRGKETEPKPRTAQNEPTPPVTEATTARKPRARPATRRTGKKAK